MEAVPQIAQAPKAVDSAANKVQHFTLAVLMT